MLYSIEFDASDARDNTPFDDALNSFIHVVEVPFLEAFLGWGLHLLCFFSPHSTYQRPSD